MSGETYTIGEIKDMFDLETPGDAWALVIDSGWDHENSANGRTWQVTIPPNELPRIAR